LTTIDDNSLEHVIDHVKQAIIPLLDESRIKQIMSKFNSKRRANEISTASKKKAKTNTSSTTENKHKAGG